MNQSGEHKGIIGSSQSIADTQYSATNYPLLKEVGYTINNPRLGTLEGFEPQGHNKKKG